MSSDPSQKYGWREFFNDYSILVTVIGSIGAVVTIILAAVLALLGWLPGYISVGFGAFMFGVLAVGILGQITISNRREPLTLGDLRSEEVPHRTTRSSSPKVWLEYADFEIISGNAIARFDYNADVGAVSGVSVRAKCSIYDSGGTVLQKRYDAIWKKAKNHTSEFDLGDSDEIVIAIIKQDGILSHEHHKVNDVLSPIHNKHKGSKLYVKLELNGSAQSIVQINQTIWYAINLSEHPPSINVALFPFRSTT